MNVALGHLMQVKFLLGLTLLLFVDLICILSLGGEHLLFLSILGHEAVGQVAESTNTTDFNGSPLKEGDRITWSIISSCGTCLNCAYYQLPQKCETLLKYGHAQRALPRDLNGGFAQYIRLQPGTAIFRLPDSMIDSNRSHSIVCS